MTVHTALYTLVDGRRPGLPMGAGPAGQAAATRPPVRGEGRTAAEEPEAARPSRPPDGRPLQEWKLIQHGRPAEALAALPMIAEGRAAAERRERERAQWQEQDDPWGGMGEFAQEPLL
ncbi:hypothetical protein ACFVTC_36895 [Streptomyces sp. NPDC057950]|uniref:hypothetical protein n=1 Tax=Streptomyces sp. NPDC057950 TaxID=3346288 RepID=UPI0036E08C41